MSSYFFFLILIFSSLLPTLFSTEPRISFSISFSVSLILFTILAVTKFLCQFDNFEFINDTERISQTILQFMAALDRKTLLLKCGREPDPFKKPLTDSRANPGD